MNEIEAFAILNSIPLLGGTKIRLLIQEFGSATNALKASKDQIKKLAGFKEIALDWSASCENTTWRQDLELAKKLDVELIPFTSPHYPQPLLQISDPPTLLYVQGTLKPQDTRSIAIVGTRHASIYGNEMAEQIGKELAAHGFTIVSGLARGIDTAAHQGALERGRTIAVIGSGLADIYPPENRALANSIKEKGALMSEFSMTTPPDRQNFPQRNRIVSGMTLATLLIEAPLKSGAMITMEKGYQQKKKLFALPGRADHENFRGNHHLIKTKKAELIENVTDILVHFENLFPAIKSEKSKQLSFIPNKTEALVLKTLSNGEMNIDLLAQTTKLPIQEVHAVLTSLTLKKTIKEFPGKIYKAINSF